MRRQLVDRDGGWRRVAELQHAAEEREHVHVARPRRRTHHVAEAGRAREHAGVCGRLRAALGLARLAAAPGDPALVALLQVLHEGLLVGLRVVDEARQSREPLHLEPVVDDVDCRALLADEEDALPAGDVVGDEVRDRLRFPGPGWPLDDEAAPAARPRHGAHLRRVGGHDVEALERRERWLLRLMGRASAVKSASNAGCGSSDSSIPA